MKHKIKVEVPVEKRGFLGSRFRWCSRGAGMGGYPVNFEEISGMMWREQEWLLILRISDCIMRFI